jgi:hypothetical protein
MCALHTGFREPSIEMRETLHPLFSSLTGGISEFTFANIYLFRKTHSYRIGKIPCGPQRDTGRRSGSGSDRERGESRRADESALYVITGAEKGERFLMLPFGIPPPDVLSQLMEGCSFIKCVSESQVPELRTLGFEVSEDRDNFDYIYLKSDLAELKGRRFHRKKNLVNAFVNQHNYEGRPLDESRLGDALEVIEEWRKERSDGADYEAAREAVEKSEELVLCGGIYYVDGRPAAYSLGEEIAGGNTYAIHFEKAVGSYKGLYQFINMSFAAILPEKYRYINREQDLGIEGLRKAKMSYNPHGFIKKHRACRSKAG